MAQPGLICVSFIDDNDEAVAELAVRYLSVVPQPGDRVGVDQLLWEVTRITWEFDHPDDTYATVWLREFDNPVWLGEGS